MSIYGKYRNTLDIVLDDMVDIINKLNRQYIEETGFKLYEHLNARVKEDESMREKCRKKGLEENERNALREIYDSVGLRIVCSFVDDIYNIVEEIKKIDSLKVVEEKDYIKKAKENGYRSYHIILEKTVDMEDVDGNTPGKYYVEMQLRTIAMDSWAALEHEISYKKNIKNRELIKSELKRCADELAGCDMSMQTIRDLIVYNTEKE